MSRYKLFIEYDGTDYSGWQKQPNAVTIEGELEKALTRVLQEPVDIIGQGRTDAGVHAEAQVAHFDTNRKLSRDDLLYALLGVLPRNIGVWDLQPASDDFHARFDAKSRQYRYQFVTRPSPLAFRFAKLVNPDLNFDAMQKCASLVAGTHDFQHFCKSPEEKPNTVCSVEYSIFKRENHRITYYIRADRFVHHMVRRLVGTMLQVGKGKKSIAEFRELLDNPECNHTAAGIAAKGLILEKVSY